MGVTYDSAEPSDRSAELLAAIVPVPELYERISRLLDYRPDAVTLSVAGRDKRLPFGICAGIFAGQSLAVAADHLRVWTQILDGHLIPVFAHMTLIRSALEGAIRCRWLVDPKVDGAERAARV
jgi:hypothetical protein